MTKNEFERNIKYNKLVLNKFCKKTAKMLKLVKKLLLSWIKYVNVERNLQQLKGFSMPSSR